MNGRVFFLSFLIFCSAGTIIAESLDIEKTTLLWEEQLSHVETLLKDPSETEKQQLLIEQKSIKVLLQQLKNAEEMGSLKTDSELLIAQLQKELENTKKLVKYLEIGIISAAAVAGVLVVAIVATCGILLLQINKTKKALRNKYDMLKESFDEYTKENPPKEESEEDEQERKRKKAEFLRQILQSSYLGRIGAIEMPTEKVVEEIDVKEGDK
jgi:hypothetical protein